MPAERRRKRGAFALANCAVPFHNRLSSTCLSSNISFLLLGVFVFNLLTDVGEVRNTVHSNDRIGRIGGGGGGGGGGRGAGRRGHAKLHHWLLYWLTARMTNTNCVI